MGQGKTRAYKHRLDKYYHLARQVGYRSRAAFKLIQLNQQFNFLNDAHVCLDLCAAPGGWSQVAAKYMPPGAQIIAIDLAPIKDIPRVIALQGDILLPKTHQRVRKLIQGQKADVVLNDGAPNVGAAWVTDSSNQLELCLASVKFSTLFLRKGGAFVTKVFRSEHYNSLLWVLSQFFEKVVPTKPKASRDSSAELFVVALDYKAPDVVDQRLLDPTYVFSDLDDLIRKHSDVSNVQTKMTSIDYQTIAVSEYLRSENPLDILQQANKLVFADDAISQAALNHPLTTGEIKTLLEDLKLVGFSDRKVLLKWRNKLRNQLLTSTGTVEEEEKGEEEEKDESDEEIQSALAELKAKRRKEEKAQRRHKAKLRDQLLKRLQRNMGGTTNEYVDPKDRFQKIETPRIIDDTDKTYEEKIEENIENYENSKLDTLEQDNDDEYMHVGPHIKFANTVEIDESKLPEDEQQKLKESRIWYNQEIFEDVSDEDYTDYSSDEEQDAMVEVTNEELERMDQIDAAAKQEKEQQESAEKAQKAAEALKGQTKREFDATAFSQAKLASSKRGRRELIEQSFNRFMHGDDDTAPEWFKNDEKKYSRPMIPVSKDEVAEYRQQMKEIDEVDTKRVLEARARKRTKALQKIKAAQEKVDDIAEKEGLNERSKLRMMDRIADKVTREMKPAPTVVVTQKRDNGKPIIPKHAKGSKLVFVDPRSKKDLRAKKNAEMRPKHVVKKKKSKYIHRRK